MASIDSKFLLNKMEYNQKIKSIEERIKKSVFRCIKDVQAIIIYGSAIQTNYKEYNDIDIIIATKMAVSQKSKIGIIKKLEEAGKKENLNLDIQIYSKNSIMQQYPYNPSLIYQLKDSKVIYGNLKLPKKINLSSLDLNLLYQEILQARK